VTSALIYPSVVGVMAVGTVIILATFVLPKFRTFFASLNAKLPLPTRMLLSISGFISTGGGRLQESSCLRLSASCDEALQAWPRPA